MFDGKSLKLDVANSHWPSRDDRLSLADRIALQSIPRLRRGIYWAGSTAFQSTGMIKMCVSKNDSFRLQGLKLGEPIRAAVNQNSAVHHEAAMHPVKGRPCFNFAARPEKSDFHCITFIEAALRLGSRLQKSQPATGQDYPHRSISVPFDCKSMWLP